MRVNLLLHTCLLVPFLIIGQNQLSKFRHLTLEDGLSQSSVTCILKDSRGFMWFGTEDGLNKYDGADFTVYRHIPNDAKSLSSSNIQTIVEQGDGVLWIGTTNGLNSFDPDTETFTRYQHRADATESLSDNNVVALEVLKDGTLLVGTQDGLSAFSSKTGFVHYTPQRQGEKYAVRSLVEDASGHLWVLSSEGLEKISWNGEVFRQVYEQKTIMGPLGSALLLDTLALWISTKKALIRLDLREKTTEKFPFYTTNDSKSILSIRHGPQGTLWVGTNIDGLIQFSRSKGKLQQISHNPFNPSGLNSNAIRSIFLDEELLWLGTYGGGINKYDAKGFRFEHYKHYPGDKNSISDNRVRALLYDRDGELWAGTHEGLNRINRNTKQIIVYTHDSLDVTTISSGIVRSLEEDVNGKLWIGTWFDGLNSFDKKRKLFQRYLHFPGKKDTIGQVRSLESDDEGNIWVGAADLWRFNPKTGIAKKYSHQKGNENSLSGAAVNTLYFGSKGKLWIGTQNGLNVLDTVTGTMKRYLHRPKDTFSLSHDYITSLAEDKNGALWIGTYGGGINVLEPNSATFRHYTISEGLLNDVIYGILIDENNAVWFTSNAGLTRFDPHTESFRYFGMEDGIQNAEFNAGAYARGKNGEFFFGGINGFNAFYPDNIKENSKSRSLVFTDFKLLDEQEQVANTFLDKHISRVKDIVLKHDQNTLAIKFAELNYADKVNNTYEYQLKGYEENWNLIGEERWITLGNLDPGSYVLQLRIQKDITKNALMRIRILPPLWQSGWAYGMYIVCMLVLTLLIYRNVMKVKRIRRQFELRLRNWEKETNSALQAQAENNSMTLSLQQVEVTSADQQFLERAVEVVESHLEDSGFAIVKFTSEMGVSRSKLHRKLKELTGYSTTKFVRLIRLKRAAQLLKGNSGTVSEIAYKVGFDNIGYFSKCFRETFGKSPSQYSDEE
ncbi:ligand-binding sensor domain-containing protein [Spongiimicrobium salis]|uniref:ligand-binding sensor domain-containing protein n=1 Tax=Spongiimicrobium salis TaxID=1667022 RepID=UPI00374D1383